MRRLLSRQVDYADLYFQYRRHESWLLEEGRVKSASHSIEQGVGVRAVSREKTGLAYSDEIGLLPLLDAANAAPARLKARSARAREARAYGLARMIG